MSAHRTVECIIPILNVSDLPASITFYTTLLGFHLDWRADPMASLSRDGQSIMLCHQSQGHPGTWLWIGVRDIRPLHAQFFAAGVKILLPPTNFPYAYEFQIEDPDRHVLRFGSDPITT